MNKESPQKIGVLGGSFDPVHNGHLKIARGAAEILGLSKVLLVPAANPPHKPGQSRAPARHRLEMCRLACEGAPPLEASDCEIRREGPSYTADTILELRGRWPAARLYLICGADMFLTLLEWKNSGVILQNAVVCMAPRGEYGRERYGAYAKKIESLGGRAVLCELPKLDISSTMVRQAVRSNRRLDEFVPAAVADYICRHGLYTGPGD